MILPDRSQAIRAILASPSAIPAIVKSCPTPNQFGVTFDDGPSEETPGVLALLKQLNVKATFYVVGSRVIQRPQILKQTYEAGHEIGLHTWSHPDLTTLTEDQVIAEIAWNLKAIKDAIGIIPKFLRPPFGAYNDRIRAIAAAFNLTIVHWNRDSEDWKINTMGPAYAQTVQDSVKSWVSAPGQEGNIVLMHDLWPATAAQAPGILKTIMQAGGKVMPVASCLGLSSYYESGSTGPLTPSTPTWNTGSFSGGRTMLESVSIFLYSIIFTVYVLSSLVFFC